MVLKCQISCQIMSNVKLLYNIYTVISIMLPFSFFFRTKQHYENYEPTLKALRQKYEVRRIFLIFILWFYILSTVSSEI